ncbi:M61 family peptidase [Rufibacter immobilis]|uniref:M61 family peptidase n=1 Tax=Rufibacter immobilis TaxID=1348778 RepID=A0A3M9MR35_9BACT|nr:PDZ domain-containing protein [Rufibacter immobilis]RNI27970.1 M61 family peptidase [Rufibacter immobilis]
MQKTICSRAWGVLLLLALALSSSAFAAPSLSYRLSMPEPHTHYFEVEMRLQGFKGKNLDVTMPVWAPGSYLIREFPKNVEAFEAYVGNSRVNSFKTDKNTWRVAHGGKDVTVKYKVYAFELSVRTSFIDASHGYLNGTSVFMYPEGHKDLPSTLTVVPFKGWSKVSTGLPPVSGQAFTYKAPNYDVLADSPIEIGNHEILSFESNGVKHEVAMYGEANYDPARLTADMKKVTEEATKVFGELPLNYYLFIVHNLPAGGGGLEHLNSTTLHATRTAYGTERGYKGFLNLVAHEYFHLWNVKRLRPIALGPFDYNQENYSHMLWVSEGFTTYYADVIMRRAGFTSEREHLDKIASSITSVENTPGNKVVSAAQSSFDAWIKQYRPDENSYNTHLSYYSKGALLGMLLDTEILKATNGTKSLDDALKALYEEYYKKKKRGFTDKEFQEGIEKFTGRSMNDFFQRYVYGKETPDYNAFLGNVGITLTDLNKTTNEPLLGAGISTASGRPMVTSVTRNGSAWQAGLNVNDEIIAMNGYRVTDDINRQVPAYAVGDVLELLISRGGQLSILPVTLLKDQTLKYRADLAPTATDAQKKNYLKWTSAK